MVASAQTPPLPAPVVQAAEQLRALMATMICHVTRPETDAPQVTHLGDFDLYGFGDPRSNAFHHQPRRIDSATLY